MYIRRSKYSYPFMHFRFQRGGLKESLETTIDCNSFMELKSILRESIRSKKDKITIDSTPYAFDERVSQQLYMVYINGQYYGYLFHYIRKDILPSWTKPFLHVK